MSCEYAIWDGSYVIGALSPAERLEFEHHLAGCKECARAVREVAGLPGLLAGVEPAVLEHAPEDHPLPASLLPALLDGVRRSRRRRGLVAVGLVAATLTAIAVPVAVTTATRDDTPPVAQPSVGRVMAPVGTVPVRARLAVQQVAWGTRLDLTCTYARDDRYQLPRTVTYGLFVENRQGGTERVGTWRALDGRTMQVTAATATDRRDIRSVQVRTADGHPVLELTG
jgi:hypothetical protein